MITQLNPQIPVYVVENPHMPSGSGVAFALVDYSIEHDVIWGVGYDANGEIWWVPNKYVRLKFNRTLGRIEQSKERE